MSEIVVVELEELEKLIQRTMEELFKKYEDKKPVVLLTRKEVSKRLGVSPGTISEYIKNRRLKNYGIGRKILISEEDITDLRIRPYTRYIKK